MTTLADVVAGQSGTDAEVLAYLDGLVAAPRVALVSDLRQYMTTQAMGEGIGKRTLWDAIREFAESGTVAGVAYVHAAAAARRSAARGILEMLRHGGEGEGFPVADSVVQESFVALGAANGGPAIISAAQLTAIAALGQQSVRRWQTVDEPEPLHWGVREPKAVERALAQIAAARAQP